MVAPINEQPPEILTVSQSEDGKKIKIEGTPNALNLVVNMGGMLLRTPDQTEMTARNATTGVEITIERIIPELRVVH